VGFRRKTNTNHPPSLRKDLPLPSLADPKKNAAQTETNEEKKRTACGPLFPEIRSDTKQGESQKRNGNSRIFEENGETKKGGASGKGNHVRGEDKSAVGGQLGKNST